MKYFTNAFNALYLYRNGYLETLNKERYNSILGNSLFFRLRVIITNTIKEFNLLWHKNPQLDIEGKIVCIINSQNNYESLKFLDSEEIVFLKPTIIGKEVDKVITYRFKAKILYSFYFIFSLPLLLIKKANRRDLKLLHKAFGLTALFSKLIKKQRPRKVIFANDHIPDARSYIFACQNLGVETVYIQHGSVSKYFPPLEFNLALLESQYSKDIYIKGNNLKTEIKLIGIPKLDKEIKKVRNRSLIKTIGVAINQNDDLFKIEELIESLKKNHFEVILRKHPADIRKIAYNSNIINGNEMNVFEFINYSDFIIASDSSIHVEANSLKCRSLYYKMHNNKKKYDYYEFVKNCFVEEALSIAEIIKIINQFSYDDFDFFDEKIKYYNSTLTGPLYGLSSDLVLNEIL